MSNRGKEWADFNTIVEDHIENYTVPQYGDMPDDQMTTASLDDIKHDVQRYLNRIGRNARGIDESLRDMVKMAHYACIAYNKIKEGQK